jgi:hypothetical protein
MWSLETKARRSWRYEYESSEIILYLQEGNKLLLTLIKAVPLTADATAHDWLDDYSYSGSNPSATASKRGPKGIFL